MTHRNAPLSFEGRLLLVRRCQNRPIAHVAAEMGISRSCASKWVNRYRQHGERGLLDRSSTPRRQPTATDTDVVARIDALRRAEKWSASRIAFELQADGVSISRRTMSRRLLALGLNRRRFIDPSGDSNREPRKITARRPGHMVHIDVKKVGRIPEDGGRRAHGRASSQAKALERCKKKGERGGYVYLHSAVDGFSRLAYTEALPDEKAATAIAFLHRARAWFAAHGITRIERNVTDNGACYRADAFALALLGSRHQRITPYTPRHNGKVERYNRRIAEEFLCSRTWLSEEQRPEALRVWNVHYNYHRPLGGAGGQPPALRLRDGGSERPGLLQLGVPPSSVLASPEASGGAWVVGTGGSTFLLRNPLLIPMQGVHSGLGGDGLADGDRRRAGDLSQGVADGRTAGPRRQVQAGDACRELGTQRSVPADPQRGAPSEGLVTELVDAVLSSARSISTAIDGPSLRIRRRSR